MWSVHIVLGPIARPKLDQRRFSPGRSLVLQLLESETANLIQDSILDVLNELLHGEVAGPVFGSKESPGIANGTLHARLDDQHQSTIVVVALVHHATRPVRVLQLIHDVLCGDPHRTIITGYLLEQNIPAQVTYTFGQFIYIVAEVRLFIEQIARVAHLREADGNTGQLCLQLCPDLFHCRRIRTLAVSRERGIQHLTDILSDRLPELGQVAGINVGHDIATHLALETVQSLGLFHVAQEGHVAHLTGPVTHCTDVQLDRVEGALRYRTLIHRLNGGRCGGDCPRQRGRDNLSATVSLQCAHRFGLVDHDGSGRRRSITRSLGTFVGQQGLQFLQLTFQAFVV